MIYRGTTPLHTFGLPFDLENIANVIVTYQQNGCTVLQKDMTDNFSDISVDTTTHEISVRLNQNDTMVFTCGPQYRNNIVQIQLQVLFENGSCAVSDIIHERVIPSLSNAKIYSSNNKLTESSTTEDDGEDATS